MADQKLSALTEAPAVAATDLLYAVAGGASRKVTVATLLGAADAAPGPYVASEALAQDDVLYVLAAGTVGKAQANSAATLPGVFLAGAAAAGGANVAVRCVGRVTLAADPSWTPGAPVYVSANTAGGLTQIYPDSFGEFVQVVGLAVASDELLLAPQLVPTAVPA